MPRLDCPLARQPREPYNYPMVEPIRVMLDASPVVQGHAGIARYTEELAAALLRLPDPPEVRLFSVDPEGRKPAGALAGLPHLSNRRSNKGWRLEVMGRWLFGQSFDRQVGPVDVFHGTDHLLPPFRTVRTVFTVFDLSHLRHPETHLPLNRTYLTWMMPRFARGADRVIAISESTAADVVGMLGVPRDRVRVIPLGVGPAFGPRSREEIDRVRARHGIPERYVLTVSTIEPRKNLRTLVDAFLDAQLPDVTLVLAGREGWLTDSALGPRAREASRTGRIVQTGFVEDRDLPALYSGAMVFAFPSLFEGFGLPVLEAMACGAPVLVSRSSSLPEVVGDAGELLPPTDTSAWTQGLSGLIEHPARREELRARGMARAHGFSWDETARRTLDVYREIHAHRT